MKWIKDLVSPETRAWEEFYRNRWQHDKVVRSTHGVNCTGGCSWNIYVKDGIVTWEMQALDYPLLDREPAALRAARLPARHLVLLVPLQPDPREVPVHARRAARPLARGAGAARGPGRRRGRRIQDDPEKRARATSARAARAASGARRWDEAHRADRRRQRPHDQEARARPGQRLLADPRDVACSATPPARASCSSLGGVNLVLLRLVLRPAAGLARGLGRADRRGRVADWYNSKMIAVMGSNLEHDPHARLPLRRRGAAQRHQDGGASRPTSARSRKYADQWIPLHAGQDGAFWMAVNHVILKEFHAEQQTPVLPRLRQAVHRRAVPGRARRRDGDGYRRRAGCCAPDRLERYAGRGERRVEVPGAATRRAASRACRAAASATAGAQSRASGT